MVVKKEGLKDITKSIANLEYIESSDCVCKYVNGSIDVPLWRLLSSTETVRAQGPEKAVR